MCPTCTSMLSKPASTASVRGPAIVLDDALNAGRVDGAQARAHRREAAGGREGGGAVGPGVGHRPGVADLRRRGGALGMHGVGQPAQARHGVVVEEEAVPIRPALGRDGQVGHRGQRGPAGGHAAVELDQRVAHLAPGGHPFEGGGLDDAVAQGQRPQGGRGEDGGDGVGVGGTRHGSYLGPPVRRPHAGLRRTAPRGRPAPGRAVGR